MIGPAITAYIGLQEGASAFCTGRIICAKPPALLKKQAGDLN